MSGSQTPVSVLLVSAEPRVVQQLKRGLEDSYRVAFALSASEAGERISESVDALSAVVVDLDLPDDAGIAVLGVASRHSPTTLRVAVTARQQFDVAVRAINDGHAEQLLTKPVDLDALRRAIEQSLREQRMQPAADPSAGGAHHDALTGLYNHRYLCARVADEIDSGHAVALCSLRVKNLQAINETFGYVIGDRVLKSLADALKPPLVRRIDVVARHYSGDKFGVLLIDTRDQRAETFTQSAREALSTVEVLDDADQPVSIEVAGGFATTDDYSDALALLSHAFALVADEAQAPNR